MFIRERADPSARSIKLGDAAPSPRFRNLFEVVAAVPSGDLNFRRVIPTKPRVDFSRVLHDRPRVKAAEIIAEIKSLPPEEFAEVSAFMLEAERADLALQIALQRKQESTTGQVVSRPYEQVQAAVRAKLNAAR